MKSTVSHKLTLMPASSPFAVLLALGIGAGCGGEHASMVEHIQLLASQIVA